MQVPWRRMSLAATLSSTLLLQSSSTPLHSSGVGVPTCTHSVPFGHKSVSQIGWHDKTPVMRVVQAWLVPLEVGAHCALAVQEAGDAQVSRLQVGAGFGTAGHWKVDEQAP